MLFDPNTAPLTTPLRVYGFKNLTRPMAVLLSGYSRKTFDHLLAEGLLVSTGGRKKLVKLSSVEHLRGSEVTVNDYLMAARANSRQYPPSSSVSCYPDDIPDDIPATPPPARKPVLSLIASEPQVAPDTATMPAGATNGTPRPN